jgi:predicted HTH transcriptional regulator
MKSDFFGFRTIQEDYDTEFKSGEGKDGTGHLPKCVWETYSAMANTEGGVIFLGVKELKNGTFDAVGVKNFNSVIRDLWNGLNNPEKVSVNLLKNGDIEPIVYQDVHLIKIKVPQANRKQKPVYINGNPLRGTFRRNNDGDYRCSEDVVKQMLGDQVNDTRDSHLMEGFGFEDIHLPTFQVFRQHFANRKPNHPFNDYNDQDFLRNIGGWGRNRESTQECLTLAGLLMFGKLRSILDAVPNYIVDYQERSRFLDENRWIDRMTTDFTWSGNLYDFYRLTINKLYEGLKVPFTLSGDERVEDTPIHEALREALVNTIVHADYSGNCSILVVKRPDLFGFRNPGLFRVPQGDALRGGISDCRNRNLQKMFQLIGLGEQAGSGFPKIYKNWNEQHWKSPGLEERFESNQTVLVLRMTSLLPEDVVLYLKKHLGRTFDKLDQLERIALVTAKAEGCVTHRRLVELSKEHPSELTRILHGLVDQKILTSEGAGKGTFYYLTGEHPIKGDIVRSSDSLETLSEHLIGNSEHLIGNSEHLIGNSEHLKQLQQIAKNISRSKKSSNQELVIQTILDLCRIQALSISEMAQLLNRKENSLRNHYINPMCDQGILKRQYPNILNHPKQKYYTSKND